MHHQPMFTADARYNQQQAQSEIAHVRYSDKGKYLSGLIQVFGNFWTAKEFCDRRFWRHMFTKLANDDARKNENAQQSVANLLRKRIPAGDSPDRLAGRVLGLVRRFKIQALPCLIRPSKKRIGRAAKVTFPAQLNYPQGNTIVSLITVLQI